MILSKSREIAVKYNKKVIHFPASDLWRFWDYVELNDENPIEKWVSELSLEAATMFNDLLRDNHKTELPQRWSGFRGFMEGNLKEERIWELGFKADGRQYRILGKFGNSRKQAILLIGCYHKMTIYHPMNSLKTAYKRSRALSRGEAKIHERKIRTDS